jgi:DNA-binding NtrC family response regulator
LKISNDIVIFIVEDDQIQADILNDKLLEYNAEYAIMHFKNGSDLLSHLKNAYAKNKYNYVILDYYLQTKENAIALNGLEVIKLMSEQNPKVKIIVFSAFENDDDVNFMELMKEPNVIECVKKSDHAFSRIQNILRYDYAENSLFKRKRRFQWALLSFIIVLSISLLHFIFSYFSF